MHYNVIGETGGGEATETIGIESVSLLPITYASPSSLEYSTSTSPSLVSKKMAESIGAGLASPSRVMMEAAKTISAGLAMGISDHDGDRLVPSYVRKMLPDISKVIFNPPATVVIWGDGAKTVVKVKASGKKKDQDKFSEEVGLAMAIAKRYFGSRSAFLKAVENAKRPNATDEQ